MDPVTLIFGALIAGAAAGLKDTASSAIKDGYAGLKRLLSDRYDISTRALEKRPDAEVQRAAVKDELVDSGVGDDVEVLAAARELLNAVRAHDTDAAASVGVDLSRIDADEINISRVTASGGATGVRASDVTARGAVNITDIEATGGSDNDRP